MWTKVLLVAVSALFFAQIASGEQHKSAAKKRIANFFELDGHTYYVVSFEGYSRDVAMDICKSQNMTFVTFETQEKWLSIVDFLATHYGYYQYFWIGAVKDAGSTTWNWQDSGAPVEQFYWRPNEPDINQNLSQTCLEFQPLFDEAGWGDIDCNMPCDILCQ